MQLEQFWNRSGMGKGFLWRFKVRSRLACKRGKVWQKPVTCAIDVALSKWAGLIGLQPVSKGTNHKSIDDRVHKKWIPRRSPVGAVPVGTKIYQILI